MSKVSLLAIGRTAALACTLGAAACGGTGLGADTRADITARMTSAQQPLAACYHAGLAANRKLTGMMVVSFVAAPQTGQFQEITITRDDLNDPGVRKCVVDEIAKLKLEKPQSARVSISYPIHFAPNP
ncbi:MAG TPA: AgmX/PglI C-terminal domain-containing protein [Kofleriaceae bacterium]